MHHALKIVICGTLGVAMGVALPLVYAQSGEDAIKGRVSFMREQLGGPWKVLAGFVKGQGSLADVEKSAQLIASRAKNLPQHFPKDSGRGAFPDDVTRALPAIWQEPQKFQGFVQQLEQESTKLAALAKAGDKDAVMAMLGESGSFNASKLGCGDCHRAFQGPAAKK
jgi:cytochrome c556